MANQDITADLLALVDAITARPGERDALVAELRAKLAALRKAGAPVPPEFKQFEDEPLREDADDMWDNMPV